MTFTIIFFSIHTVHILFASLLHVSERCSRSIRSVFFQAGDNLQSLVFLKAINCACDGNVFTSSFGARQFPDDHIAVHDRLFGFSKL